MSQIQALVKPQPKKIDAYTDKFLPHTHSNFKYKGKPFENNDLKEIAKSKFKVH